MPESEFACPYCRYEAPLSQFDNVGDGELKCRRCRSRFPDPNAFSPDTSYADCDSLQPVTRFPFTLRGVSPVIRVRENYLALLTGADGQTLWLEPRGGPFADLPFGCQLYYFCLSPRILWGTSGIREFGAFGSAQLTLSKKYVRSTVEELYRSNRPVQALENELQKAVNGRVADYISRAVKDQNTGLLEQRDGYMSLLGTVRDGIQLNRIDPMGFRNGRNKTGVFFSHPYAGEPEQAADTAPAYRPPVDFLKAPKASYTVKSGIEEVFVRGQARLERHKAGERMDESSLQDLSRVFRFRTKAFEFPSGWGIFNQSSQMPGYFSAQGTISFYVDSTEKMSALMNKTKSWQEFEEQFFTDIFRKELSAALREIVNRRAGRPDFRAETVSGHLSAMSVELTAFLNGEDSQDRQPAFRRCGLRVKQTDILGMDFYSVRR